MLAGLRASRGLTGAGPVLDLTTPTSLFVALAVLRAVSAVRFAVGARVHISG